MLLSSYEFKRPLHNGAWCKDLFLVPEDAAGRLREANPPRGDGTGAKVGTDAPPSPAAAPVREGTPFPELLPLLVTALLPPPPFVLPVLLLLVLGTELAPPASCCGRLFDITLGRPETPTKSAALLLTASGQSYSLATLAGLLTSCLAQVLASWGKATAAEHPAHLYLSTWRLSRVCHWWRVSKSQAYKALQKDTDTKTDNKITTSAFVREISRLATVSYG